MYVKIDPMGKWNLPLDAYFKNSKTSFIVQVVDDNIGTPKSILQIFYFSIYRLQKLRSA